MPTFPSRPLPRSGKQGNSVLASFAASIKRRPVLCFGAPFVVTICVASYGLSYLTQTKYDYNASKVKSMSKEEELGMRKDRRKIDIREEYYKLTTGELEDWEPKRIERPAGVPEWGLPPSESPDMPAKRSSWFSKLYSEGRPDGEAADPLSGQGAARGSGLKSATVLGPDGKPCRACNSKLAFAAAMKGGKGKSGAQSSGGANATAGTAAAGAAVAAEASTSSHDSFCPPDGEELGRSTWTFLHSAAAYYPYAPSRIQKESMLALLRALPHTYPCAPCATSLGEEYARESREGTSWNGDKITLDKAVENGKSLRRYLCGLHNEVNERLGKDTWKCEEDLLRQRWKDGPEDGSCD